MPVRRYLKQFFDQEWKVKPCRQKQGKPWNKYVGELFEGQELYQGGLLDDIQKGQCPSNLFLSNVNEFACTKESNEYVEGLNSKVKLGLHV